ncbi:hypothetical protein AAZX31_07G198800 [Glycine max]
MQEVCVSIISRSTNIIEGFGKANILLLGGTKLHIDNALYSSKSHRNLYHIETNNEENDSYIEVFSTLTVQNYDLFCIQKYITIINNKK